MAATRRGTRGAAGAQKSHGSGTHITAGTSALPMFEWDRDKPSPPQRASSGSALPGSGSPDFKQGGVQVVSQVRPGVQRTRERHVVSIHLTPSEGKEPQRGFRPSLPTDLLHQVVSTTEPGPEGSRCRRQRSEPRLSLSSLCNNHTRFWGGGSTLLSLQPLKTFPHEGTNPPHASHTAICWAKKSPT